MIYDILEQKLEDGVAELVIGSTVFRMMLPDECSVGVMTRTSLSGVPIDPFIPNWHVTDIQVVTRHTDPVEGYKLALAACEALKVESIEKHPASSERGPAHITLFFPKTLPVQFPRLEGNGYEFSQQFRAAFGIQP